MLLFGLDTVVGTGWGQVEGGGDNLSIVFDPT
jgi:hypothetical protein